MFRDGSTPPACGHTPKPNPGNFGTGSTRDAVVFSGYAPSTGTCVTVEVNGDTLLVSSPCGRVRSPLYLSHGHPQGPWAMLSIRMTLDQVGM